MTFLIRTTDIRTPARAYCGMWIVDCLRCKNAERLDRFQPSVGCTYCGVTIEIVWPSEEMVHGVERLLLMRPLPYTQNWNPGEDLHDLLAENAEHGVFTQLEAFALENTGSMLTVIGDKITRDRLPVTRRREMQEIT